MSNFGQHLKSVKQNASKPKPLPVILLLDTSGSMTGEPIDTLNKAVKTMIQTFSREENMEIEILVSIITFESNVDLFLPYTSASDVKWKDLTTGGCTSMGGAFEMVKRMIEDTEVTPKKIYRPIIILVTDGEPTDDWQNPLEQLVSEGRSKKCDRIALAIGKKGQMGSTADEVLKRFVEGTEKENVFYAEDVRQIRNVFNFVTMTVTTRAATKSNDRPSDQEIKNKVQEYKTDNNSPFPDQDIDYLEDIDEDDDR